MSEICLIFVAAFFGAKKISQKGFMTTRSRWLILYIPLTLMGLAFGLAFWGPEDLAVCGRVVFNFLGLTYLAGSAWFIIMNRNRVGWVPYLLGGFLLLVFLAYESDLRVNWTDSMPKGVYLLRTAQEPLERGDLVTFCLESNNPYAALAKERGYLGQGSCPSGLRPLLKKVAGLPGDLVQITPDGIYLNGQFLPGTIRPQKDRLGRDLPPSLLKPGRVPQNFALTLATDHSGSFDSRHFGLAPLDSLQKVEPVFIQQSTEN